MLISFANFVLLTYLTFGTQLVLSEDYIGCLFSQNVCEDNEMCFNDNAFGQCISRHSLEQNQLQKYTFSSATLIVLEQEMKRLYLEEYKWSDKYTQCIIQTILESHQFNTDYNPKMCNENILSEVSLANDELTPKQIEQILSAKEMAEEVNPYDVANIRFEPSIRKDLEEFADEIFFPLRLEDDSLIKAPSKKASIEGEQLSYPDLQKLLALEYLQKLEDDVNRHNDGDFENENNGQDQSHFEDSLTPEEDQDLDGYMAKSTNKKSSAKQEDTYTSKIFRKHNYLNIGDADEFDDGYGTKDINPFEDSVAVRKEDPNMLSTFQRWDRLDTKKPGPEFSQHGQPREEDLLIASESQPKDANNDESKILSQLINEVHQQSKESDELAKENPLLLDNVSSTAGPLIPVKIPVAKKKQNQKSVQPEKPTTKPAIEKDSKNYQVVQSSYAYLLLDKSVKNIEEGQKVVHDLERQLELPANTFSDIKIDGKQITFKVNRNPKQMNASDVANKIESLSSKLEKNTGFTVESTGIGNEAKLEVSNKNQGQLGFILTFVLVGTAFGVLVAVVVVYVVRRHARTKAKLRNIGNQDTEASLDYQDLCRQRMASKSNDKPEPIHVAQAQRISSLSQSEGSAASPTSRSSTSSWSEEPVTSNMDISTGHVILSYMEDHLKNKDRLDREWEALCAYEAEPCSTDCATAPNHIKKNRFPNVIPYDHSRVILNETTNISSSSYINASTITDHDPRTPAYIATQGPLPHTAADFWQMVWEQGSVVIVMLTRLMENGVALCHRYWPEEGSELYHIYEVHLVSEHIWCDDYLIRSFYLKNLKTGETRTVTQFHFLSWPENGVPPSIKALLEFRRKVNKSFRGRSCPIITHCSDGSGRTGTYCLIDMVLNRMDKGAKEIDIAATLEHIRDQRVATVKTKAQFEFVLMAIAEEVHAILKAMPQ